MADTSFTPQEIEQFLQQFFDVVGARQYIGARYVPIFGRAGEDTVEWDDQAPYEPLTVVMHDGVSYVSRRYVPAGIEISDTDYWVETYRFNAQVEQYRQEVLGFQDQIDDKVPFPDATHYPRLGTLGQVLSTLADGTTKWEDPVVPSDEQAEEVISQWLEDHPEATTTVQDGSITDAKISENSSIAINRGVLSNTLESLTTLRTPGYYAASNNSFQPNDAPTDSLGICEIIVYKVLSNDRLQIVRKYSNGKIWTRLVNSNGNPTAWYGITTDNETYKSGLTFPSDAVNLASLRDHGDYSIQGTDYDTVMNGDSPDFPNDAVRQVYLLENHLGFNGNFFLQRLICGDQTVWERIINASTGSVYKPWKKVAKSPIADADVSDTSTIFRTRANISDDSNLLSSHWRAGIYYSSSGSFNPSDAPVANIGTCELLVFQMGNNCIQVLRKYPDGPIWERFVQSQGTSPESWQEICYLQDAYQANVPIPDTYVNLASLRTFGDYKLPVEVYETIAAGSSPDFPTDADRDVYALRNESAFANHIIQTLINHSLKSWQRIINRENGQLYKNWIVTYDPNRIITTDVLAGKKLVTAGDSYTHAHYATDPQYEGKNYGYYVAQRYGMEFVNDGISGSIMALSKEHVADPDNVPITDRNPFSYQRYLNVPSDADYLTIWFGINDVAHTNLGTINDTTNETFYGAWNVVLEYYLTNRPFLKIGLIVTTGANAQYREAVREVAQRWGYPFLDWEKDVEIPAFFDRDGMSTEAQTLRRTAFGYDTYSAHPSPQWHEYASSIYENFLRSL